MPAMRSYTVTQEREVKVRALNPTDAVFIANRAFEGDSEGLLSVEGSPVGEVIAKEISAREDL